MVVERRVRLGGGAGGRTSCSSAEEELVVERQVHLGGGACGGIITICIYIIPNSMTLVFLFVCSLLSRLQIFRNLLLLIQNVMSGN